MLWKPKEARKFVKICENLLKFIKIRAEECFDKVLNEEFKKNLMCKMKNVITRQHNSNYYANEIKLNFCFACFTCFTYSISISNPTP
jgi:hypothetical protein